MCMATPVRTKTGCCFIFAVASSARAWEGPTAMIDLYTARTPNGSKVSIMLEECRLPYRVTMIDIVRGDQFQPQFLEVNPNGKIPAIVDAEAGHPPVKVFESGAILVYLAEKTGRFLSDSAAARAACMSWLFWQVGNVGPMFGQANHFATVAPERPANLERGREAARHAATSVRTTRGN